jgi:hypothetical protein
VYNRASGESYEEDRQEVLVYLRLLRKRLLLLRTERLHLLR